MQRGDVSDVGPPEFESVFELRPMAPLTDTDRDRGLIGAGILGVSRKTLWRARASGKLPPPCPRRWKDSCGGAVMRRRPPRVRGLRRSSAGWSPWVIVTYRGDRGRTQGTNLSASRES